MKIWILYDNEGTSSSESVSYELQRFMEEGKKSRLDIEVHNPSDFELFVDESSNGKILLNGEPVDVPDVVIPRTLIKDKGGYFPMAVIRHLEHMGAYVLNGAASMEAVIDKLHTHQILVEHDIPTPATLLAKFPVDMDIIEEKIGFPLVVKTLQGTCGSGVFMAQNKQSFKDVMDLIAETNTNVQMIFQKFVASSHGRDLRLLVCGGKVIAAMERQASEGGFKANFTTGGSVREYMPDRLASDMALRTAKALGLEFAGIDLLFDEKGGYTVCEANSMPGFKGIESCCAVNVPKAVFDLLKGRKSPRFNLFRFPINKAAFAPFRGWKAA